MKKGWVFLLCLTLFACGGERETLEKERARLYVEEERARVEMISAGRKYNSMVGKPGERDAQLRFMQRKARWDSLVSHGLKIDARLEELGKEND